MINNKFSIIHPLNNIIYMTYHLIIKIKPTTNNKFNIIQPLNSIIYITQKLVVKS